MDYVVDYAIALNDLLKEQPELRVEAQRIFLEGATTLEDPEHPSIAMNSYERIYKAVKEVADRQSVQA